MRYTRKYREDTPSGVSKPGVVKVDGLLFVKLVGLPFIKLDGLPFIKLDGLPFGSMSLDVVSRSEVATLGLSGVVEQFTDECGPHPINCR